MSALLVVFLPQRHVLPVSLRPQLIMLERRVMIVLQDITALGKVL